jgi:O-antigen/teichoic acid export membrane protein
VGAFAVLAVLGAGLLPFFAAQILVGVVLLGVTPVLLGRHHLVAPRWSNAQMRALIGIALPVAIANVLGILYLRILVILMSLLSDDPVEIGDYVTSTRVVELVAGLPFLLGTVILPVLTVAARDDQVRMRYINARMTETMALGGILVALVVSFGADPIVIALGGDQYKGAVEVLQIQCLAVVTIFLASAWNQTLVGMGQVRALVVTTGTGLAAVVIAGVALIPSLDAEGAAIAAVIADLVLCVATYVALRRAGPGRDLPLSRLLRVAGAAVPAVAVGLVPGVPDVVNALAAGAVFVVAAALLRAVPSELVGAIRDLRGSNA